MRNVLSSIAVVGLVAVLAGGAATAQTAKSDTSANAARAGWMSAGAVITKLEGQGYTVHEFDIDDGTYEIKALDTNGARVEVDLDPKTGEPIGNWRQDD